MENPNHSNNSIKHQRNNRNRMMVLEKKVVGLAIVAAMNINITNTTEIFVSSAKAAAANFRGTNGKVGSNSPTTSYFLSSCNLCNKHLHGLDIFIYRGERAFCSAECRETHIRNKDDYHQDKYYWSGVSVMMNPLDSCTPPPRVSLPAIAAA